MTAANKSSVNFAIASKPFIDAGISDRFLIPVVPFGAVLGANATVEERHIGKAPGRYNPRNGTWGGLYGKGLMTEGTTADEVRAWAEWPTANVGVLGLGYPAIDSDAESPVAAKLVMAALVKTFGKDFGAAERIRGKGHRRLFAFASATNKGIRTRHVVFTPAGDKSASKVDVIGRGGQYVASGRHPTGDAYEWRKGASLLDKACPLDEIADPDVDAFLLNLKVAVEAQGGTMDKESRGGAAVADRDVASLEPAMSIEDALHGLNHIPNSEANFPDREDFVSMLAAVKAALGSDAERAEDDIREWAVNSAFEPEWCSEEYFQKAWDSLHTVRMEQDTLERIFRRAGMTHVSRSAFPDNDSDEINETVTASKKATAANKVDIIDFVADLLAFRDANNLENLQTSMVRDRDVINVEIKAIDWWKHEAMLSDPALLTRIQTEETYPPNRMGLANFLRDMRRERPDSFFDGTIMDPKANPGEIVSREADGHRTKLLNVRRQSQAIVFGRQPSKDPRQDKEDVRMILDLMERMFGKQVGFELDTLAYMAQTGDRPGSMLFLVGDKGVGKSLYINMLQLLFDGKSSQGRGMVDGTKLSSESGRRFAYAAIEGCRIVSLREIPNHMSKSAEAEMTATFKNMCDRGLGGDLISVEGKGVASRYVENVCRIVVSSNHHDAIEIEEGDRRIFYVDSGINVSNRFSERFYAEFSTISDTPERLAAFWRYLLNRDIGTYSAYTAPPVTREKLHRSIMSARPTKRHFLAAIAMLNNNRREVVTNTELKEIMHRMAIAEHENSSGAVDDIFDYRTLTGKTAFTSPVARELSHCLRSMPREKFAQLGRDIRAGDDRVKVYVLELGVKERIVPILEAMSAMEVVHFIENDRRVSDVFPHPLEEYQEGADPNVDI